MLLIEMPACLARSLSLDIATEWGIFGGFAKSTVEILGWRYLLDVNFASLSLFAGRWGFFVSTKCLNDKNYSHNLSVVWQCIWALCR